MEWVRRKLWILSGDDIGIIPLCSRGRQVTFAGIGFFVLLIFGLCFVSCYISYTRLFQSYVLGIPVGLFIAFTITNLYLLALYTLSKNVLPHSLSRTATWVSLVLRVISICFIAVIVSKPFEAVIFSGWLDPQIEKFKIEQLQSFRDANSDYFEKHILDTQSMIHNLASPTSLHAERRLEFYENRLVEIHLEKAVYESRMEALVENSNYYIRSIAIMNREYPSCWLISLAFIIAFTFPLYVKRIIPLSTRYYEVKRDIEVELIKLEYAEFLDTYRRITEERWSSRLEFVSKFEDAPFNTKLRADPIRWKSQDSLIDRLYRVQD